MISITKKAADKVLEIAAEEELEGKPIRVKVVGGGCAGMTYDLYYEENEPLSMDEEFGSNGVKILCDPLSYQYLDGVEIDYVESPFASGFKFINPNVSSSCGCGLSVAF